MKRIIIGWIYRWIDRRGRIPMWCQRFWPWAHWCPEMDGLLVLTKSDLELDCFCDERSRFGCPDRSQLDYEDSIPW